MAESGSGGPQSLRSLSDGSGNVSAQTVQASSEIVIHKIYLKDLSLESPNAPGIFNEQWQPQVEINVQNAARKVGERVYEVVLTLTVTTRIGEHIGFLVEVHQAGLFELDTDDEEEIRPLVGGTCPGILYPYAREAVSDMATRGGFPALLLQHADFESIYDERSGEEGAESADR